MPQEVAANIPLEARLLLILCSSYSHMRMSIALTLKVSPGQISACAKKLIAEGLVQKKICRRSPLAMGGSWYRLSNKGRLLRKELLLSIPIPSSTVTS
jgi:DNA-binding MarR family transcriptional regulator